MSVATTIQYKFIERTENVTTITFKNSNPLKEVESISYYREENMAGELFGKFRYSFDGATWTNYQTLNQINVNQIPFNSEPDFYFEVVYNRVGITSGNIEFFYLIYQGLELFPGAPIIDPSIDADFLGGQPPLYYLDRSNHTGAYLDFVAKNVPGLGIGTMHNFANDQSTGINLEFKRINATDGLIVVDNGGIITISDDPNIDASVAVANIGVGTGQIFTGWDDNTIMNLRSLAGQGLVSITQDSSSIYISVDPSAISLSFSKILYSSNLDPSISMTTAFRSFPVGTTVNDLEGKYLESIIDDILFPTVNPDFIAPSSTFNNNVSLLYESNTVLTIQFNAIFDRGSIDIDGNFQNYRSGLPNFYNYSDPSSNTLLSDIGTILLSDSQIISGYVVKDWPNIFSNIITYDIGPQPYDNKGVAYSLPLNGGSTSLNTITVEGAYPNYATTSSITVMSKQTLISMQTGNNLSYSLVAEQGGSKHKIDIPVIWTNSRPLIGIQQYNSTSQSWEYPGGSGPSSLDIWTITLTSHIIKNVSINYNKYTYNGPDRSSVQIRLIF